MGGGNLPPIQDCSVVEEDTEVRRGRSPRSTVVSDERRNSPVRTEYVAFEAKNEPKRPPNCTEMEAMEPGIWAKPSERRDSRNFGAF